MAESFFDKGFLQHLLASWISIGLFETDKEGKVTGINPAVREKIGPSFMGLNKADEIISARIEAALEPGERTVWGRLVSKLKKHQVTQIRILQAGVYKEFDLNTAVEVTRSFLNIQEDDDDSVKIKILIDSGIITEKSVPEEMENILDRIYNKLKKQSASAIQNAIKAGNDFVDSYKEAVNEPLKNLLTKIKNW